MAIVGFMVRYLDLLVEQVHRTRQAMAARCHEPRWLWQSRPLASSMGVTFVRSYERGERVHQAMLARGYAGTMPELDDRRATAPEWWLSLTPGLIAILALIVGVAG